MNATRGRRRSSSPGRSTSSRTSPTKYLLCRGDRMFPAAWARRHARERLGIEADEMDGGHYLTLSRPAELAGRLDAYAAGI